MPRQYSPKYKQTQITGFYSKGKGKHRKVIPLSKHGSKRQGKKRMQIASVIQPTKPTVKALTGKAERVQQAQEAEQKYEQIQQQIVNEIQAYKPIGRLNEYGLLVGRQSRELDKYDVVHTPFGEYVFKKGKAPNKAQAESWNNMNKRANMELTKGTSLRMGAFDEPRLNTTTGNFKVVEHGREMRAKGLLDPEEEHRLKVLEKFWADNPQLDKQHGAGLYVAKDKIKPLDEPPKYKSEKKVDPLLKAEKAAVKDEVKGEKEYKDMAKQAKKEGHPKDAKVFESHAKDEKRHGKEDAEIVAKQEKEKAKEPSVKVEYTPVEQKPQRQSTNKGQDMPTASEIETEAYRLYMVDNHGNANVTTTPERHELIEEGYIKAAQHHLMATGEQNELEKAYIENLNRDLAEHGYIAVPIGSM